MTVAELIGELLMMPQDAPVFFLDDEGRQDITLVQAWAAYDERGEGVELA